MREAIGGTLLMQIVIVFLVIYIFFMAVVINYGRVFRTKNNLISFIEAEEGFKEGGVRNVVSRARELGYNGEVHVCYTEGKNSKYFSVTVFITFQLPMVSNSVQIPISGETSAIRNNDDNTNNTEGIKRCYENGKSVKDSSYNLVVGG